MAVKHPVRTWIILLTVDAVVTDGSALQQYLPSNAQVFTGADTLRTGIVFKMSCRTLRQAQAIALNQVVDLLPQLNHQPVTTMQSYPADIWEQLTAHAEPEPFMTLLFGPPVTPGTMVNDAVAALAPGREWT